MSPFQFCCPTTKNPITIVLPAGSSDPRILARHWNETLKALCPHCGQTHELKTREAYLISVLSEGALRGLDSENRENAEIQGFAERMVGRKSTIRLD
jgi:hypothetical protein